MIGLDRPRLRGVVTATSLHTLDHGREARVVADNGAFRYDATLFSRDKRHLLLRRSSEKERRRERGSSFTKRPLTTTTQPSIVKVNIALTPPPPPAPIAIDEYPREAGFACTILHPRRKNICMRVMKGWGKKLADSLGSSVAVERIQRTARPEGLMRRAIRKQPRLIAARTASDIAGSGESILSFSSSPPESESGTAHHRRHFPRSAAS